MGATRESLGGVVFRAGAPPSRRFFLPADVVVKVTPHPQIARLPGAPPTLLGITLDDGAVLPLLELGPDRATMILCVHRGEPIGLVGAVDIRTGVFPAADGRGVEVDGVVAAPFDLEEIYARVHAVTWGATWG